MDHETFEPKVVAFLCNWCSYRATDMAGTARIEYPSNVRTIRVMCSGRVDPTFVLKAFSLGADGVLIAGCHPGECHYVEQNIKTMRRYIMLRHTLRGLGIEDARVRLVWASASEGRQIADTFGEIVEELRQLGPLRWRSNWGDALEPQSDVTRVEEKRIHAIATGKEARP